MHIVLFLVIGRSFVNIKTEDVTEWPCDHQTCTGMLCLLMLYLFLAFICDICVSHYCSVSYFWPCNIVKCGICYENVCPSVCVSHLQVIPKKFKVLKVLKCALHYNIQWCFWFLEAKFCNPEFRGSLWTSPFKRGTPPVDSENLTNPPQCLGNGAR